MTHRIGLLLLLLLTSAAAFAAPTTAPLSTVVHFEAGKSRYFRMDGGSGSSYIALLPDGSYRFIRREHMFVEESDRGTWQQDREGTITAVSAVWFDTFTAGPFNVSHMRDPDYRDRLTSLAMSLRRILADSTETTMTPKGLQERMAAMNGGKYLSFVGTVDPHLAEITHSDLRVLLAAAETPTLVRHVQHLTPRELDGVVFLDVREPRQFPWWGMPLHQTEKYVGEAKDKSRPFLTTVEIPEAAFESESRRTQEFRYLGRK